MIFHYFQYFLLLINAVRTHFPGEGNGNPLQCSCLENPVDRGAWQAKVHGAAKESDMTKQQQRTAIYCLIVACVFSEHFKGLKL